MKILKKTDRVNITINFFYTISVTVDYSKGNTKRIIKLKSFNKYKFMKPKNFKEIQELNHSVRLKTRSICI